jgi:tRNA nucleotidyltransferase (CCA-adding enzyme)
MKSPFLKALPILEQIEQAGFEAYFVGGSIRDLLLKRKIDDVDIATSATPDEIKQIFLKTVDVGIAHGTVVVLYEGESYEITTFRSESEYSDFRRPNEVNFIRSLEEDLRRRDFTMNAMAMKKDGALIDPFHGQAAIQDRIIRTVGNAGERFHEDALRMMRAVRFVSQLSFSIDELTYKALKEHGKLLTYIAVERITTEFEKLLLGTDSQKAVTILVETEIYQYLPGFHNHRQGLNDFCQQKMNQDFKVEEYWVLLLYHFKLQTSEVESFLRSWKQPVRKVRRVKEGLYWLYIRLQQDWTSYDLYLAQEELARSTETLYLLLKGQNTHENLFILDERINVLPIKKRSELEISGQDLMEWYQLKGGPWIEEKLVEIEKAVINRETVNTKESIREWLFQCNQP